MTDGAKDGCSESMRTGGQEASQRTSPASLPGFTLIELLIATAITGTLMTILAAIVMQFFQVTIQSTNRLAVLGDVALATQALARDVNSAAIATVSDPYHLTLMQPDPDGGASRTVTYAVRPPLLERNGQAVARYVTSDTALSPLGSITATQMVTVKIVSRLGSESQQQTVQISLRPQP